VKIHDVAQLSPEWHALHLGRPTCSRFSKILTGGGKLSAQADEYMNELAADILAPDPDEPPLTPNYAMNRGIRLEPEARRFYELEYRCEVTQVGFYTSDCGRFGGSPDGLVGANGGLEMKCPGAKQHIAIWRMQEDGPRLPAEYKAQVHGHLWLTGRLWWDFLSYHPSPYLPALRIRVQPDEYTEQLGKALEAFRCQLDELVAKLRAQQC
jgi:YqaJ-like viral recombinase domain